MRFNFWFPALISFSRLHAHAGHDHSTNVLNTDSEITDHDLEHLKTNKPIKEMTRDERQFFYFKQADTDNDDHLDGLEMLQMLIKFEAEDDSYKKQFVEKEDNDWCDELDRALKNQDFNDDGFVSFFEFQAARKGSK